MLAAFLITLREGFEAGLIVGITLSALHNTERKGQGRAVWLGVALAVLVSVAAGLALNRLGVEFEGRGEQIFEGAAMFLAAAVLTWMIFWMQQQGRRVQAELRSGVQRAVGGGGFWALFTLAFAAVVREGIETVLFLTAAAFGVTAGQTLLGGGLGLLAAIALGWLIFAAGRRVNVSAFFRATSVFLILFAAGLVARGVSEFQEASLLPTFVEHVWDMNNIINENGTLGTFLTALLGYNGDPSLLEVSCYVAYYIVIGLVILIRRRGTPPAQANPR